jgi:hypothetical protein
MCNRAGGSIGGDVVSAVVKRRAGMTIIERGYSMRLHEMGTPAIRAAVGLERKTSAENDVIWRMRGQFRLAIKLL